VRHLTSQEWVGFLVGYGGVNKEIRGKKVKKFGFLVVGPINKMSVKIKRGRCRNTKVDMGYSFSFSLFFLFSFFLFLQLFLLFIFYHQFLRKRKFSFFYLLKFLVIFFNFYFNSFYLISIFSETNFIYRIRLGVRQHLRIIN